MMSASMTHKTTFIYDLKPLQLRLFDHGSSQSNSTLRSDFPAVDSIRYLRLAFPPSQGSGKRCPMDHTDWSRVRLTIPPCPSGLSIEELALLAVCRPMWDWGRIPVIVWEGPDDGLELLPPKPQ